MDNNKPNADTTIIKEIEVAGGQLVDKIKSLIKQGNVRQLRLWVEGGDFTMELPMTIGVIAGGAVMLTAPWLAILGVIAALVTKVRIEVELDAEAPAAPADDARVTLAEPKSGDDKPPAS